MTDAQEGCLEPFGHSSEGFGGTQSTKSSGTPMALWVEEGKDAAAERKKATKASVSTCLFASRPAAAKFRPATVVGRDFVTAPAKK